jgi:hypothetical protein
VGDLPPDDAFLSPFRANCLEWFAEAGFGYFECTASPYDAAYFDRYLALEDTPIGRELIGFRSDLLSSHCGSAALLDVGIGSGAFLKERWSSPTIASSALDRGYDVNPAGVAWLKAAGRWGDLYDRKWKIATFWDSLEHIRRPDLALAQVSEMAFVSIPVFTGPEHVLRSKHYRRDEHFFYWTRLGFINWAAAQGFRTVDVLATESAIGREDVETFVLRRE